MPGEAVLRQSAVQMMGEDKINRLNAAGNRRASAVPSLGQTMAERKPDTTNVYVVAPEHKPSLGKNDVLMIMQEDMLTGGQSKRLVKATARGQV